jgi:hypothetical protein
MRLVFEIFPSFCYRRTRNQSLQILLHGNYVVAILPTGFGKYRSFAKQNYKQPKYSITTDVLQLDRLA